MFKLNIVQNEHHVLHVQHEVFRLGFLFLIIWALYMTISIFFRVKVREGRFGEITQILGWYEYINDVILDHLDDEIKSTNKSGVWRYLISFKNLLRAIENIGIVSVYGIRYLTTGNVTQQNFIK